MEIVVKSPKVKYSENYIEANYDYLYTKAEKRGNNIEVRSRPNSVLDKKIGGVKVR